jgi:hypothetical protein
MLPTMRRASPQWPRVRYSLKRDMICLNQLAQDLKAHSVLCHQILSLVEEEHNLLRAASEKLALDPRGARKNLLAQLTESLNKIREHRVLWLKLEPEMRQEHPGIAELLRENQNLIMKILVLDRENEQALLRKGMVPNRHMPSANRQRPHFVASMYQRNAAT